MNSLFKFTLGISSLIFSSSLTPLSAQEIFKDPNAPIERKERFFTELVPKRLSAESSQKEGDQRWGELFGKLEWDNAEGKRIPADDDSIIPPLMPEELPTMSEILQHDPSLKNGFEGLGESVEVDLSRPESNYEPDDSVKKSNSNKPNVIRVFSKEDFKEILNSPSAPSQKHKPHKPITVGSADVQSKGSELGG